MNAETVADQAAFERIGSMWRVDPENSDKRLLVVGLAGADAHCLAFRSSAQDQAKLFEVALAAAESLGDPKALAVALENLAIAKGRAGDPGQACRRHIVHHVHRPQRSD